MTDIRSKLKSINVKPQKTRGQNFAVDNRLIDSIFAFGEPKPDEYIIEIGPGLGALTERLYAINQNLKLIEIEAAFCKELREKFPKAEVVQKPFQEVELDKLPDHKESITVFGNVPYIFSTDIIFHLINYPKIVKRAVLLLQKEFAERVCATPGGREYGVISIMVNVWCETKLGPVFDGTHFYPAPKVNSRCLELKFRKEPLIPEADLQKFKKIVKASFLNRRKMLHNSLKAAGVYPTNGDELLKSVGIMPSTRAEEISVEKFYELSKIL